MYDTVSVPCQGGYGGDSVSPHLRGQEAHKRLLGRSEVSSEILRLVGVTQTRVKGFQADRR